MNAFTTLLINEVLKVLENLFIAHESDIEHAINLDIQAIEQRLEEWVTEKRDSNTSLTS